MGKQSPGGGSSGGATELQCEMSFGGGPVPILAALLDGEVKVTNTTPGGSGTKKGIRSSLSPKDKRSCASCLPSLSVGGGSEKEYLLSYGDLLGAALDKDAKLLRLVHCPPSAGPNTCRVRNDVVLSITGGTEALDTAEAWASKVSERCLANRPGRERYLVLINPASGIGNGRQIWAEVKQLWELLPWIGFEEVFTTRAGEATDRVKELRLEDYTGVVIVSGDGMVYEVFNGLSARLDKDEALQLPVGHIPAGSGNGLIKSVLSAAGETFGVLDAAFLIAKRGQQPIDLYDVRLPDREPSVSFLSLSGGVIADIDLESEFMRCLGKIRFDLYGVWCVIRPRALQAELAYWPANATEDLPKLAPALADPLPTGPWERIDDDITLLWGMNVAWASTTTHATPGQELADGSMSILLMRRARRIDLLQCLLGLESGGHVGVNGVQVLKCRAFRLTPRSARGHLAVDGEEVPLGPIQFWPTTVQGRILGAPASDHKV